jgi:methylated-DNA-protein-cysteine methyltransferase-like protein
MMRAETAEAWRRAVYAVVRRIPPGRVATYGLVGMVAGRPLAARAVGNALRHCDDPKVPCHRVVRSDGLPAFAAHRTRLRREGVRFVGLRVDVTRQLWTPRLPQRQTRRPSL